MPATAGAAVMPSGSAGPPLPAGGAGMDEARQRRQEFAANRPPAPADAAAAAAAASPPLPTPAVLPAVLLPCRMEAT